MVRDICKLENQVSALQKSKDLLTDAVREMNDNQKELFAKQLIVELIHNMVTYEDAIKTLQDMEMCDERESAYTKALSHIYSEMTEGCE